MQTVIENLKLILTTIRFMDLIDLLLVWLVVYRILLLIKSSGAVQIFSGLGIVAIAYISSIWAEWATFNWILEKFFSNLFVIVVILFQGEIRRALAQIGSNPFLFGSNVAQETQIVEEIAKAAVQLADRGFGALIVLEREIGLEYFIEVGTELDSNITAELLLSLFHTTSPLHDGAVIIRKGRMAMAGCFLPLSKNPILDKNLGTRHRAAIGLTEETDAIVIVVSEEKSAIGIAHGGQFTPQVGLSELRQTLYDVYGLKYRTERGTL